MSIENLHQCYAPTMALLFEGYSQHEFINELLELISDGEQQHIWSYSQIVLSENSIEFETFDEWHDFLQKKKEPLIRLFEAGYKGLIRLQIPVPLDLNGPFAQRYRDYVFFDSAFIKLLAETHLRLEVQYKRTIAHAVLNEACEPYTMTLQCPLLFYDSDESNFFNWLSNISGVSSFRGCGTDVILYLNQRILDDVSLRSLIALMARYGLDMSCLRDQLDDSNAHWLKKPESYFYESIFGGNGKSGKRTKGRRLIGTYVNIYPQT